MWPRQPRFDSWCGHCSLGGRPRERLEYELPLRPSTRKRRFNPKKVYPSASKDPGSEWKSRGRELPEQPCWLADTGNGQAAPNTVRLTHLCGNSEMLAKVVPLQMVQRHCHSRGFQQGSGCDTLEGQTWGWLESQIFSLNPSRPRADLSRDRWIQLNTMHVYKLG